LFLRSQGGMRGGAPLDGRDLRSGRYLVSNFVSAVGIIFLNKLIFRSLTFDFPTTLSLLHYATSYAGLELLRRLRVFSTPMRAMTPRLWLLTVVVGLAPPLNNLSLKLNSVGFYTLAKLLVTPIIAAMEWLGEGKTVSVLRGLSLAGIALGVGVAAVAEVQLTLAGLVAVAAWLPVAALYKVHWSRAQKEDGWTTLPLMHRVLPYSMVWMALLAPATEVPGAVLQFDFSPPAAFLLALSALAAFAVNYSGFLVLGACSPITHVVLGQVKSAALVLGGYTLFGQPYSQRAVIGSALALVSSTAYAMIAIRESKTGGRKSGGVGAAAMMTGDLAPMKAPSWRRVM